MDVNIIATFKVLQCQVLVFNIFTIASPCYFLFLLVIYIVIGSVN